MKNNNFAPEPKTQNPKPPTILAIGGLDPSGGAGIVADTATLISLGVMPLTVASTLTAQNSTGVHDIFTPPPQFFRTQLEVIAEDYKIDAIKIGILGTAENIKVLANFLKLHTYKNIVLDPVIKSSSGETLLNKDGLKMLIDELLPLVDIITPNISETEILADTVIKTKEDIERAAKEITKLGPKKIIIKGGHLKEKPVDLLYENNEFYYFKSKRLPHEMRGTGCIFASSLTAYLSLGKTFQEATELAKGFVFKKIRDAVKLGSGFAQTIWE